MARRLCVPERTSKFVFGILMLVGAIGLFIISLTILPVVGLVLAIPALALAYYFFSTPLDDQCKIQNE